jgi:hypothetical protein
MLARIPPLMNAEEQSRLDSIVRQLACRGCVSEASARRLVNDLFLREEIADRYVRTEVGYVALGLSTFQPRPPIAIQETISWVREMGKQSPEHQPKPAIPTEKELRRLNEGRREMRFLSMPVPGRPNHSRWLVTIIEDESPEILHAGGLGTGPRSRMHGGLKSGVQRHGLAG